MRSSNSSPSSKDLETVDSPENPPFRESEKVKNFRYMYMYIYSNPHADSVRKVLGINLYMRTGSRWKNRTCNFLRFLDPADFTPRPLSAVPSTLRRFLSTLLWRKSVGEILRAARQTYPERNKNWSNVAWRERRLERVLN